MRPLLLLSLLCACGDTLRAAKTDDTSTPEGVDADGDGSPEGEDCDDSNDAISPDAAEVCNGIDDDCDAFTDAQDDSLTDGTLRYEDADGDGYGDPDRARMACDDETDVSANDRDCDDRDAAVSPEAVETCSSPKDDDCDGDTNDEGALGCFVFYADADEDGFGGETSACLCQPDEAYPALSVEDCLDTDAAVNPDGSERCANGIDDDCDGTANTCVYQGNRSLDEANARVYGEATDEGVGAGVDSRDQDGDGVGELLIRAASGRVERYAGPFTATTAFGLGAIRSASSAAPLTQAAFAEDLDGDGLGDTLLGAPAAAGGQGIVYLWRGGLGGGAAEDLSIQLTGPTAGALSLAASVGDLDGDGDADLLLGAPGRDVLYRVLGPLTAGGAAETVGDEIRGAGGSLSALAGLGDTDGDGLADAAAGGPERSDAGRVWLMAGPLDLTQTNDAAAEITATVSGARFGEALCAPGDANGDGYADLFVGAPGIDLGDGPTGGAFLFAGPLSGELDESAAIATLAGEYTKDEAGAALGCGGDMDADGALDFAVGAPFMDQVSSSAGMTYLTYGPLEGAIALKLTDAFFEGREGREYNGSALSLAVDLGGEGYADLVIGAPGRSDIAESAGAVELFFGLGL